MKMIITGANGFIGTYLVDYFSTRGVEVTAFVYPQPSDKKPGVLYQTYDLGQPLNESLLAGCDILIHCAYIKSGGMPVPMRLTSTARTTCMPPHKRRA